MGESGSVQRFWSNARQRAEHAIDALTGKSQQLSERIAELESLLCAEQLRAEGLNAEIQAGDTRATALESQLHEQHLKVGLLEARLQAAVYQARRMIWQAKALAQELAGPPLPSPEPPREIPPELLDRFTLNGRIPIEAAWADETGPGNHPLVYRDEEVDAYLLQIRRHHRSERAPAHTDRRGIRPRPGSVGCRSVDLFVRARRTRPLWRSARSRWRSQSHAEDEASHQAGRLDVHCRSDRGEID